MRAQSQEPRASQDLTGKQYWDARQAESGFQTGERCARDYEWSGAAAGSIRFGTCAPRMLEIGCNPGYATLALLEYFDAQAYGVDFNAHDQSFVNNVLGNGKNLGRVFVSDVRDFDPGERYDLVFSCGFIEHFQDFGDMVRVHASYVAKDGYVLVAVPNFRRVQWLYHRLFDRADLDRHNIASMDIEALCQPLRASGLKIVAAGYAGRMRFWGADDAGNRLVRGARSFFGRLVRSLGKRLGRRLPAGSRYYSPWLYVLAQHDGH